MLSKIILASCMVMACLARPDRLPSNNGFGGYQPPQPQQSYSQPRQQQPQPSYSEPQQTYSQPRQQQPQPSYSAPQPSYGSDEKGEPMPFNFNYEVKDEYSGNDFSHSSDSDGHVVKGEYRVLLPDGRTQIVTYIADHEDGYKAEVTYEGEARYDEPQQRSYSQPEASYQEPQRPQNTYQEPQRPQNTYQEPQRPQNTYQQPQRPQNTYQQPQVEQPRNTYQQPSQPQPPRNTYGF